MAESNTVSFPSPADVIYADPSCTDILLRLSAMTPPTDKQPQQDPTAEMQRTIEMLSARIDFLYTRFVEPKAQSKWTPS